MSPLSDPGAPAEPGESKDLRAKDLKGIPTIFRPFADGKFPPNERLNIDKETPYIACECWTLDRAGVVEHAHEVRVSWWRTIPQLRDRMGEYVAARPIEESDRSIVLHALEGEARAVAEKIVAELEASDTPAPDYEADEDDPGAPF